MPLIDRNPFNASNLIQVRPRQLLLQLTLHPTLSLHCQYPPPPHRRQRRPLHSLFFHRRALHRKRKTLPPRILNPSLAPPQQPQPRTLIEISQIPRPMPHPSSHPKLRLLIPHPPQISRQHMIPMHHNLAHLCGLTTIRRKRRHQIIPNPPPPPVPQNPQLNPPPR